MATNVDVEPSSFKKEKKKRKSEVGEKKFELNWVCYLVIIEPVYVSLQFMKMRNCALSNSILLTPSMRALELNPIGSNVSEDLFQ